MGNQEFNESLNDTDLENALHHLLTVEDPRIDHDDINHDTVNKNEEPHQNESGLDSDIIQEKHLTLESILENQDTGIFFDLDEDPNASRKRSQSIEGDDSSELAAKRTKYMDKAIYDQLLSPASLSPSSTDENGRSKTDNISLTVPTAPVTISKENEGLGNEFTMKQVSEMKQRVMNTHKLLLNFNFLKDGYARTCVEFKKALHHLKDSEIHRAHLLQENEELKDKIAQLTVQLQQPDQPQH